jgi:hypothetical protein
MPARRPPMPPLWVSIATILLCWALIAAILLR